VKQIIPYNKSIDFKNAIYEITTISLEHELNIKDDSLSGDFILSGEYKTNEISVNKEKFLYRLPFSIDFMNRIDHDTLDFNITNFEYEIDDTNLIVDIEATLEAKEELVEFSDVDDIPTPEQVRKEDDSHLDNVDTTIKNKIDQDSDTFITYHVHIMRESESLESIALLYNTSVSAISEVNKTDTLTIGSKIIIPHPDE